MTLADKITSLRLILAPAFFVVYLLPGKAPWTVPALWALFVVSEVTDMLDGMAARRLNQGSDFGKLFDPFADTLTQLTFFLCFVLEGIFPAALYLLALYREFGILFVRNLMLRKGVAMGARMAGKVKTVTYIAAGGLALLAVSMDRLGFTAFLPSARVAALAVFALSLVFSVYSFVDYVRVYKRAGAGNGERRTEMPGRNPSA